MDELATPGAGEVLIDVAAAGIGSWDELVRIGSCQIGGPVPMALGTEAAGTVAAAGAGVAGLREGDEVMTHPLPFRRHGTWAGRVLAPAATVAARPPAASWEAGGAFPIPALTAAQDIDEALGIESGSWVLVNRLGRRSRARDPAIAGPLVLSGSVGGRRPWVERSRPVRLRDLGCSVPWESS